MSTCPDKDLYSAYVDGELQSPWKEKIEDHLKSCEKCKLIVEFYRSISLNLSQASQPELDLNGSFLKLYAKRKECIQRMENNQKKAASWMYKSVKIPIPALAAAAILLFVCTPMVMLSTSKTLNASDNADLGFKTVMPISQPSKTEKKFSLNVANIFGIKKNVSTNKEINLCDYMNFYLPPKDSDFELNNVLGVDIKSDSIFLNDKSLNNKSNETVTSVKNEQ